MDDHIPVIITAHFKKEEKSSQGNVHNFLNLPHFLRIVKGACGVMNEIRSLPNPRKQSTLFKFFIVLLEHPA